MAQEDRTSIIDLINTVVVANGNNEISANDLRPVLLAMVNQINDLVGDPTLVDGGVDIVTAVNNVSDTIGAVTISLHSGIDDPNTTPPVEFVVGDFYHQIDQAETLGFFQYNGDKWARVNTVEDNYLRNIKEVVNGYTVSANDYTIIYDGISGTDVITQPLASESPARPLKIVNTSAVAINFSTGYVDTDGTTKTVIPANSIIEIQSKGDAWVKTI